MSTDLRQLSEREQEILRLVADGLSNQQIANALGVSVNTVKVHLRNVFGKIGAASRTEATMYAVRAGIVTVDRPTQTPLYHPTPLVPPPSTTEPEPSTPSPGDQALAVAEPAPVEEHNAEASLKSGNAASDMTLPIEIVTPARLPKRRRLIIGLALGVILIGLISLAVWQLRRPSTRTVTPETSADQSRWKQFTSLPTPRAAFAVATQDDQVYLIGGEGSTGVLNTVDRYDARSSTWTTLSKKPTAVTDIHAVILGGKIYVPGGRRSSDPKDTSDVFERYDPRAETWEQLPNLPQPRSGYALAALEGKLYLFGGWDGSTYRDEVFEYDPDRATWQARTPMPKAAGFADAVVVENSIYVVGGEDASGPLTSNAVYTPAQEGGQPWTRKAPLPQPRSRFGASAALSIIYVIGGDPPDTPPFKYDVRTDSWQSFASSPQPIASQPGVTLLDGIVISLGGKRAPSDFSATMQGYQALFTIYVPGTQK